MEKIEEPKEWRRPQDIPRFTTSDPRKMLNMYLVKPAFRTWEEEFTEEDTGKIAKIERHEMILQRGEFLTEEKVQELQMFFATGDLQEVEVAEQPCVEWVMPIYSYSRNYAITFYNERGDKFTFVCRAQNIIQALHICADFACVYHTVITFQPIKVTVLGLDIIEDNDKCIPEEERIARQEEKQYYKVNALLHHYDDDFQKWHDDSLDYLVTAEDVEIAKQRVDRYCRDKFSEELDGQNPEEDPLANTLTVRKAAPFTCDALVPKEYCDMYREEATW